MPSAFSDFQAPAFSILFWVAAILHMATLHRLPYKGDFVIKAIPVLCLAILTLIYVPDPYKVPLAIGFVLSAGGDISLSFALHKGEKFFLAGLVLFLLAHLTYIFNFQLSAELNWDYWPVMAVLTVFAIGMAIILWPRLGEMRLPVMVYLAVILSMGLVACIHRGPNPPLLILGAAIFMLSDSLIAIDKFLKPFPRALLYIMITYYIAQYLIFKSFQPGPLTIF